MFTIGSTNLGQGPAYVIAEVGSNWHDLPEALKSIEAARLAGANAVKFQLFDYKTLYGQPQSKAPGEYRKESELNPEWLTKLKTHADHNNIDFLCSAFDADGVKAVNPFVQAHKVASSHLNSPELLKAVAEAHKPVFLSTGAASATEIQTALTYLKNVPVCLMYCVSAYPADECDLFTIDTLRELCSLVGFSDHSLDYSYLPASAVRNHGAVAVEKHFIAPEVQADTPDSGHSLNMYNFRTMVGKIRGFIPSFIGPNSGERAMLMKHKTRLVATKAIKKGEPLVLNGNFGAYRVHETDMRGLSPFCSVDVDGKVASKNIDAREPIGAGDYI